MDTVKKITSIVQGGGNKHDNRRQLPLVGSEACVGDWVQMNLFPIDFIQLNCKACEAVIHV